MTTQPQYRRARSEDSVPWRGAATGRWRLVRIRGLAILAMFLICNIGSFAYSVLTHEEIVDLLWKDEIRPLLLKRFPVLTEDQITEAHAYAVWSKYSIGRFSARSRMMYGHHAKQKMGAVVGLCNRSGKPAVAAAKRIPGGREPDLAITPSHPSVA